MSVPNGNGNGLLLKIGLPFVALVVSGLIGWGTLNERVRNTNDKVDTKASREVVAAQMHDIANQLRAMQAQLDRIEREVRK